MKYSSSSSSAGDNGLGVFLGARGKLGPLVHALAVAGAVLLTLSSLARPCAASEPEVLPQQAPESDASQSEASQDPQLPSAPNATTGTTTSVVELAPEQDAATIALPPPPAGSGGIAVFPVLSTNLSEGESAALGMLFVSHLREEKGGRVIAPDTASKYSESSSDQQSAASYMKVEQYLVVEAVRLDRTTIVSAALYGQDGSVVRSAKMSAKSVDDFQYVAERLVLALLSGKPVEKTRTLDNVTADEADGSNQTFSEKVFGVKTAFVVPYSSQTDLPVMVALSFDGRLEGTSYFLEFGGGFLIPSSTPDGGSGGYGGLFAEIGGSYYLTHTNVSPYVGAGVMPRILSSQPANLAAYGQAGLMFFRTSSSRLYGELRVAQNLTPMVVWTYSYDIDAGIDDSVTRRLWPIEFGVNVGLGW